MDHNSEKLFVLEFVVDTVEIQTTPDIKEHRNIDLTLGQTCVTFQFLHFPPVDICEQDFPLKQCYANQSPFFKSGKSCLFAISGQQLVNAPGEFVVNVRVTRKLPIGTLPEKILVGQAKVDLTSDFIAIISDIVNEPQLIPVTQNFKDTFELTNPSGTSTVGTISIYVRFSYHGELLVTEFEPRGDSTFVFKNCKNNVMYQCQNLEQDKSEGVWKNINDYNEDLLECTSITMDGHDQTDLYQEPTRGLKWKRLGHEDFNGDSRDSCSTSAVKNKRKKKWSSVTCECPPQKSQPTFGNFGNIFAQPMDRSCTDDVVVEYKKPGDTNICEPDLCRKLLSSCLANVGNALLSPTINTGQGNDDNLFNAGVSNQGNDYSTKTPLTLELPFSNTCTRETQYSPQIEPSIAGEIPKRGRSKTTAKGKSQNKGKGKGKGKKGHNKK